MAEINLKNGRCIGDYDNPYIVAEFNSSHGGDVDVAKEMIRKAKECGCDCVKFQSWSPESLYSEEYYKKNPIARKVVGKFSLSPEQLKELSLYCHEVGIDFSSTPYSEEEVDFLVEECQVPYIKIASMEINNPRFLTYIAQKGVPMILSTGMSDMKEIEEAVKSIQKTGNEQLCLLHCVSLYPTETGTINMNNILGLRKAFPKYPIGFSDHTLGDTMDVAAVCLGSAVIEKHFTLDKSKVGMDNNMAMEPDEFKEMVEKCRYTHTALGSEERTVQPVELEMRKKMRRSIVAARDIKVGEVLKEEDLEFKRPGDGVEPKMIESLVGQTVMESVEKGSVLRCLQKQ